MKYGLLKDDHDTGYFLKLNCLCQGSHVVLTRVDKPCQVVWHCPTMRFFVCISMLWAIHVSLQVHIPFGVDNHKSWVKVFFLLLFINN